MKLEITKKLEELAKEGKLDRSVAILNMPSANYCEKREEYRTLPTGQRIPSCAGCITQEILDKNRMSSEQIKQVIDYFAQNHGTKFITIPGEGNPFHPKVKQETLDKIKYAYSKGIQAYTFNAGNGLTEEVCKTLSENETNVMMSLWGNQFIDADFFKWKQYSSSKGNEQNQTQIAERFRRLIRVYNENPNQPATGTTRLGMNYVVTERDLEDNGKRLNDLKKAAEEAGIFVVANTEFNLYKNQSVNPDTRRRLENLTFGHSTSVNGQCQMGAGSSITISPEGIILRCPYLGKEFGLGRVFKPDGKMNYNEIERIISEADRSHACVVRGTPIISYRK